MTIFVQGYKIINHDYFSGKIEQGISFERILDDIRCSLNAEECLQQIHSLSHQDLRNIKKEFLLKHESHLYKNDAVSVDL